MTLAVFSPRQKSDLNLGARLYLFTVKEYCAMAKAGILREDDPIELLQGLLTIKNDYVPPYGVPIGIPPREIWLDAEEWGSHPMRRLTVPEYERIVREGILDPNKRHELIEGWVVEKMSRNPPHDYVLSCIQDALAAVLPKDWNLRNQMGVTLDESLPEPDLAVAIWPRSHFRDRHPNPGDLGLVVEVSDRTVALDLGPKCRSYARNGIIQLWIADLPNQILHVFTGPSGPTDEPAYAQHRVLTVNDRVSLNIINKMNGDFSVRDLFGIPS